MEEIQSWWEVPAVAHFCYVFRSAFNLIFFEIAELESALLNIQDPDMSISLDQLIIRLLQGCLDEESVSEENWEEKLHELFNENCEDDEENPFDDSQNYFQLTPRSKIKILMRLCEFRLDVEGALDDIKSIPSEDMQAKCMGKDSLNNTYWYFCDERLYKEDPSSGKKLNQNQKKKEVKNSVSKNNKLVNTREKRTKSNSDVDKSWTIACFNASDWEKLLKRFSKSKSTQEKELAKVIQNHLPIVQERVSEKDRLLRKRFMELAPKRTSSRISKVQAKKRMEELKAQEEAMIAKLEAEKEQARKEALRLKEEKESRQKRAEMRHQAVEERARRAQIREIARTKSEDSGSSNDSSSEYEEKQNHSVRPKIQRNQRTRVEHSDESEASDSEEEEDSGSDYVTSNAYPKRTRRRKEFNKNRSVRPKVQKNRQVEHSDESEASNSEEADSGSDYETSIAYHQRTRKGKELKQDTYDSRKLTQPDDNKRVVRTYSNYREQARKNEARSSSRLQGKQQTVKYRFDTDESEQSSGSSSEHEEKQNYSVRPKIQRNQHTRVEHSDESEASDSEEEEEEASGSDYVTSIAYPERTRRKKEFNENHSVRSKVQKNRQALVEHSESPMETRENRPSTKLRQNRWKSEDKSESDESDDKNDNSSSDESVSDTEKDKTHNNVNTEDSVSMQDNSKTSSTSNSNKSQGSSLSLPRVTLYKTTLLKDSSDASKWNAVLDSKGQKLHILNGSCDNLSSKKPKLEEEKIFRTSTPNMKSSLLKENHIYQPVRQTPFITYGKIIPSSPSIVRLDFRKPQPPNHKVSS